MEPNADFPALHPIFLKLDRLPCIVVGGGAIGLQKATELLEGGARLTVISPRFHSGFDALPFSFERVERPYRRGDLAGARLVVSATGKPSVDDEVHAEAVAERALINVVDVVDKCDYYAGSVVRRGPVIVSISTSGTSPSLAIALKRRIASLVLEHHGALASALGAARPVLLDRFPDYGERARRLGAFVRTLVDRPDLQSTVPGAVDRLKRCERPCEGDPCLCAVRMEGIA